jgi:alkylation response protein AidB-like acyl-CoA dehydrogenase
MDFLDDPAEADFRTNAKAWLAARAPAVELVPGQSLPDDELIARARAWQQAKAAEGYGAILWPADIGGRAGTPIEQVIFDEEENHYRVPTGPFVRMGMHMAIPSILGHGTHEQLQRFAPPTLRGEMFWCQLFSEPGAGSDLAAVRTRAVRHNDGQRDGWLINGQKVWSSWAHHADYGFLLARTDPTLPKHKGLSFFLIDMRSPGIEVRPIRQISGQSDFNETFLTDVFVPDEDRIGAEGDGWACAMTVLTSERIASGTEPERSLGGIRGLIGRAADAGILDSSAAQERLARWYTREQGLKYFHSRMVTKLSKGQVIGAEASLSKLVYATMLQEVSAFDMDLLGYAGCVAEEGDRFRHQVFDNYYWSSAMRIAGGTDEILRNQIAERVLSLPGEPRLDKDVPFDQLS